jgi:hypothetical protein
MKRVGINGFDAFLVTAARERRADRADGPASAERDRNHGHVDVVVQRSSRVSDSGRHQSEQFECVVDQHHADDLLVDGQPGHILCPRAVEERNSDERLVERGEL